MARLSRGVSSGRAPGLPSVAMCPLTVTVRVTLIPASQILSLVTERGMQPHCWTRLVPHLPAGCRLGPEPTAGSWLGPKYTAVSVGQGSLMQSLERPAGARVWCLGPCP